MNDAALRLDEAPDDGSGASGFAVVLGDRRVAGLRAVPQGDLLEVSAQLDPGVFGRARSRELLGNVVDVARARGFERLVLDTQDVLLRDEAARAGMAGPLRGRLSAAVADVRPAPPVAGDGGLDAVALGEAVGRLVPGASVAGRAVGNPMRAGIRRALFGMPSTVDLLVDPDDGGEWIRVVVPRRADVVVENVARCVETLVAVRRRFGTATPPTLTVSFDYSDIGLKSGKISGSAATQVGAIHLNASHCLANDIEETRRRAAERGGTGVSARVEAPFSVVDGTTAHEMWHQIEAGFEAARYRDSIEFRRGLGAYLGVDTLERAILGSSRTAPAAWQAAHRRLVQEVSLYAGTSPREATAEMFKLWWCSAGTTTGIVACFGELVDGLFPAAV